MSVCSCNWTVLKAWNRNFLMRSKHPTFQQVCKVCCHRRIQDCSKSQGKEMGSGAGPPVGIQGAEPSWKPQQLVLMHFAWAETFFMNIKLSFIRIYITWKCCVETAKTGSHNGSLKILQKKHSHQVRTLITSVPVEQNRRILHRVWNFTLRITQRKGYATNGCLCSQTF